MKGVTGRGAAAVSWPFFQQLHLVLLPWRFVPSLIRLGSPGSRNQHTGLYTFSEIMWEIPVVPTCCYFGRRRGSVVGSAVTSHLLCMAESEPSSNGEFGKQRVRLV